MAPWNPAQYLKFAEERTRPSRDLCARIGLAAPARVVDLGCGPGNSTQVLRERWPEAEVVGVDSSPEMIARARKGHPEGRWVVADAAGYDPGAPADVIFSNAVLHWLPDHRSTVPAILDRVAAGGCLAVQVPARDGNRLRAGLEAMARKSRWRAALAGAAREMSFHDPRYYYDLLAPRCARVDLWETVYYHVLPSHAALIEWYETTGMRPYLDRLGGEAERAEFKEELLADCRPDFPAAADGQVLMPFKRLFFVAWK